MAVEYTNGEFYFGKVCEDNKLNCPFFKVTNIHDLPNIKQCTKRSRTLKKGDTWDFDPVYVVMLFDPMDYDWDGTTIVFKDNYVERINKELNCYLSNKY